MKKILVIAIAVILCLAVVGAAFALVKVEPANKVISISAGSSVQLTIGGLTGGTINPTTSIEREITLYNSASSNLEGKGNLTITASGDLAEALILTWEITGESEIDTDALASGVEYSLTAMPIVGTLTISFDDENYDFGDYAEDTAQITISFEYVDFAPVDGAWYLVGTMSGWKINKNAIRLDGALTDSNIAQKMGVSLAAGQYKAVKYNAGSEANWATNDNLVVTEAGSYNIFVNSSYQNFISAAE